MQNCDQTFCLSPTADGYTYSWDDGNFGGACAYNPGPGSHGLTVIRPDGCSKYIVITVLQATEELFLETQFVQGDSCGTAQLEGVYAFSIFGGSPPYSYTLNGVSLPDVTGNEEFLNGLAAGIYLIELTSGSCATESEFVVENLLDFELDAQVGQPGSCNAGDFGFINITTLSQSELTFLWSDGSSAEDRMDLSPGTYSVTVTSAGGCEEEYPFIIEEVGDLDVEVLSFAAACDIANGLVILTPVGGTPPYNIFWDDGAAGNIRNNIAAGVYSGTMIDGGGCTVLFSAVVNSTDDIIGTINIQGDICQNGQVSLSPSYNTALPGNPFTYVWTDENGNIVSDNSTFFGAGIGVFTLTVTSISDPQCTDQETVTVAGILEIDLQPIVLPGLCGEPVVLTFPDSDNFEYSWVFPDGSTSLGSTITLTQTGVYTLIGTDPSTGCQGFGSYFNSFPPEPCSLLNGYLLLDEGNCQFDGTEIPFPSWFVRIQSLTDPAATYFAGTDNTGYWTADVPPGDYSVAVSPYNDLYEDCLPLATGTVVENVATPEPVYTLVTAQQECAHMWTSISTAGFRRCFENSIFRQLLQRRFRRG